MKLKGFHNFNESNFYIYKITNIESGKIYIGSSKDITRWNSHRTKLNRDAHGNQHLQNSWNLHGEDNFKFEIIEYVDSEKDLIPREQYWLDKEGSFNGDVGYNIRKIADRNIGLTHSQQTKDKLRDISNDYFDKHGHKPVYDFWVDRYGEEKANQLMINYKKKHSDRTKGNKNPMFGKLGELNPNIKKIDQFTKDGIFIKTWNGIIIASKDLGIQSQNISECCLGKRKSAGGYVWKFHKDN